MSALFDSLATGFTGDAARREILERALHHGLPGPREEAWRYTSLRPLERRRFAAVETAPEVNAQLLDAIPAPRLVFANGRFVQTLSDITTLPSGVTLQSLAQAMAHGEESVRFLQRRFERSDEVFAQLNAALANDGVLLQVEAETAVETPIHLVFIGAADATDRAWHLRNLIDLRNGARLTLVEHQLADGENAHFSNVLTHVHLGQQAKLKHARVQHEAERATLLLRTDAVLAREAEYRRIDLELGAGLSRHELNVRLEGKQAKLSANGVLLAGGRRHLDTRLGIDHIAPDTACELVWRGLGAGRGRAVFHGSILIREGADGTDANLSNKNILLTNTAEIDTQPVLVIHADEVKAAHGATVGQLDANALFYLRSRGLPVEDAQRLLTAAFCRAPLAVLEDGPPEPDGLGAQLASSLDLALRQAEAA